MISQDHSHGSSQDLENTLTMHECDHEGHYREANLVDFVQSKLETPITIALLLASRVFSRAPLAHPCSSPCCTPPKRPFFFFFYIQLYFICIKTHNTFWAQRWGRAANGPSRRTRPLFARAHIHAHCPLSLLPFLSFLLSLFVSFSISHCCLMVLLIAVIIDSCYFQCFFESGLFFFPFSFPF